MRSPSPWKLPKHPIATLEQEEINIAVKKFLNAGIIEECPDSRPYLNIFKNTSLCYRAFKKVRRSNGVLLGRHLHTISRCSRTKESSSQGNKTSGILGFYPEQKKKFTNTISGEGLPGVRIRHKINEDQGSGEENQEINTKDETSVVTTNKILPLGSKSPREDNSNVTCSGRSAASYQTFTEMSGEESVCADE
ncbi:hypothetical protein MFLAVUS_009321 [Mucor flavus]|uniref:Uncharacterized protein n=1 Tax=Mucor flavus TaxID=439312 RepID=A0ABP9Z9R5_9FUNG